MPTVTGFGKRRKITNEVVGQHEYAKVLFVINELIRFKLQYRPYQWNWDGRAIGSYTIQIASIDNSLNIGIAQKDFIIINFI